MTPPTQPNLDPWLREILRCPQCKGELTDSGPGSRSDSGSDLGSDLGSRSGPELHCSTCSLAYPIENGVPVLLIELAHPLGA